MTIASFRKLALSFEQTVELPHFEKASFRVKNKIFATLAAKDHKACMKLSAAYQSVFCLHDSRIIYPVPNKWGRQGWTFVDLKKVRKELLEDVVTTAYCGVAPKRLAEKYQRVVRGEARRADV